LKVVTQKSPLCVCFVQNFRKVFEAAMLQGAMQSSLYEVLDGIFKMERYRCKGNLLE
jgi:hypothetical protein